MSLEIIKMEITRFSPSLYFDIAVLDAISAAAVVLGLLWGRGERRKKLLRSVLLLGGTALICFGSEAVLELFDMGWRCTPFHIMEFLCLALFALMLFRCMNVFRHQENAHRAVEAAGGLVCGILVFILVMKLFLVYAHFHLGSWYDRLVPYNGEMIVFARNSHGGSGAGYYYAHINSLVHGAEIPDSYSWSWLGPPRQ